jgi:hypothetical protein
MPDETKRRRAMALIAKLFSSFGTVDVTLLAFGKGAPWPIERGPAGLRV